MVTFNCYLKLLISLVKVFVTKRQYIETFLDPLTSRCEYISNYLVVLLKIITIINHRIKFKSGCLTLKDCPDLKFNSQDFDFKLTKRLVMLYIYCQHLFHDRCELHANMVDSNLLLMVCNQVMVYFKLCFQVTDHMDKRVKTTTVIGSIERTLELLYILYLKGMDNRQYVVGLIAGLYKLSIGCGYKDCMVRSTLQNKFEQLEDFDQLKLLKHIKEQNFVDIFLKNSLQTESVKYSQSIVLWLESVLNTFDLAATEHLATSID